MAKLHPDENQPRRIRSQEFLERLADNIKKVGIINPIEITEAGTIITGESRWRAAKIAGLKEVPVRILDIDLEEVMMRQMSENLHRNEMNPIDIAKQLVKARSEEGLSYDKLAQKFSLPRTAVQQYIELLSLPEPVMQAVGKGRLSWPTANAIASVKEPKQLEWLLDESLKGRVKTTRTAQLFSRFLNEGGDFNRAKELAKKVPTEAQVYKLVDEKSVGKRIEKNLKPGNHLIDIATELMLALRSLKPEDVPPVQVGRLALTLTALDKEVQKFYVRTGTKKLPDKK